MRLLENRGFTSGEQPVFNPSKDTRHEKFSEVVFDSRSNSDGGRRIDRTCVRARRWRSKYYELAGLSAASSGIEAAIVPKRATVFHLSAQGATSALLTCPVRIALSCMAGISVTPRVSSWCHRHFPAHVYKRLNRLCHSK